MINVWHLQVANGDAREENGMQVETGKVEEGDGEEEVDDELDEEHHDGAADEYDEDYYDEYE